MQRTHTRLVPILGAGSCALMMFGLGIVTWLRFIIWMAVGFAIGTARFRGKGSVEMEEATELKG